MNIKDTLRIDAATYQRIVEDLLAHNHGFTNTERRSSERYTFFSGAPAVAIINYRRRSQRSAVAVRPIDISQRGIAFLHGCFVYRGTPTILLVRDITGKTHKLTGTVANARLVYAPIHTIGLHLDHDIDPASFTRSPDQAAAEHSVLHADKSWTDLLNISEDEVSEVYSELEERETMSTGIRRRAADRAEFRHNAILITINPQDRQQRHRYRVIPTNISETGIGFLHGAFIYPGTVCDVHLTKVTGKVDVLRGTVARCEFVQRRIHDIGVRFSRSIEVQDYLGSISNVSDQSA